MTRSPLRRNVTRGALTSIVLAFTAAATTSPAVAASVSPAGLGVAVAGPVTSVAGIETAGIAELAAVQVAPALQSAVVRNAALPPVRTPGLPTGLPGGVEAASPYVGQTSCEPVNKPGAAALGQLLKATYPKTSYGLARACTINMASEHYDGRAVDWMNSVRVPAQAAQATALINWLLAKDAQGHAFANARRLGVMYMIWNNKIWESYRPQAGWQPYNNCAKTPSPSLDSSCHRNHIHFSLSWEGAMKRTSYWTKRVAPIDYGPCRPADLNFAAPYTRPNYKPCPRYAKVYAPPGSSAAVVSLYKFSGAHFAPGSNGPGVTAVQRALGVSPATGNYGPMTKAAVLKVKGAYKLGSSGVMDGPTWRAVLKSVRAAQPKVSPRAAPAPAGNPLAPYRKTVLRYDARGAAVSALQQRLKVTPVSGWYGPVTQQAVTSWQRFAKLPATGVVDERTWIALGA